MNSLLTYLPQWLTNKVCQYKRLWGSGVLPVLFWIYFWRFPLWINNVFNLDLRKSLLREICGTCNIYIKYNAISVTFRLQAEEPDLIPWCRYNMHWLQLPGFFFMADSTAINLEKDLKTVLMQRKYITHNIKFHFWVYLWTHISFLGQYLYSYISTPVVLHHADSICLCKKPVPFKCCSSF